ncbi:MAG: bifunctional folylpolyglutamate synthase/dihydrofolate synthase, partial [Hyphomicrobiaceae bacterium]
MSNSQSLLDEIRSLAPDREGGIDLSLDRMHALLGVLGNPQDRLSGVIHVAGTNGKGSTIALLKAFLEASGARVHCYTSPYLMRLHESIQIAGPGGAAAISEPR